MHRQDPLPPVDRTHVLGDRLFTIGHSVHAPEVFLALLQRHGITAVADVRSSPYSRRHPHFGRGLLEPLLRHNEIAYIFLGRELGGRPADRSLYHTEGWADYESIRATTPFQRGIDRLIRGLEHYRVAILCGEEDPLDCHRGLMIAPALVERGLAPDISARIAWRRPPSSTSVCSKPRVWAVCSGWPKRIG